MELVNKDHFIEEHAAKYAKSSAARRNLLVLLVRIFIYCSVFNLIFYSFRTILSHFDLILNIPTVDIPRYVLNF